MKWRIVSDFGFPGFLQEKVATNPGQIETHPQMLNEPEATKGAIPECPEVPCPDQHMGWKEEGQEIESHLHPLEMCSHSPEEIFWLPK